jgi:hypothetical protein
MECVNHSGVTASAYCQSCGKALCVGCVRNAAGGQILCEPCWTAWQNFQPPLAAPSSGPNPSTAAVLGVIPGVGAMYNGQFLKGLIHVVIFAVLVSAAHVYGIFGLFIAAWVLYQSFEAFHTARALRDGEPLPDPLGLNEVGNWLSPGGKPRYSAPPSAPMPGAEVPGATGDGTAAAGYQSPYQGQYQAPYQGQYQGPFPPPPAGFVDPAGPPMPPQYWRPLFCGRKEPIGAIVLIALGTLFLLDQLDIFNGRLKDFAWPVGLIGLGVWLIVRRLGDSQGGSK